MPTRPYGSTIIEILGPDGHTLMNEHGAYTGIADLEAHIDKLRLSYRQNHGFAIGFRITRFDRDGKVLQVISIASR